MATKDEAAAELARIHYLIDTGLKSVFHLTGSAEAEFRPNEPIKLLEVNEDTVPAGIMPIHFGPSPGSGVNFSSIIVEVTPEEFREIQDRRLQLPHGWEIGNLIPRPAEGGA